MVLFVRITYVVRKTGGCRTIHTFAYSVIFFFFPQLIIMSTEVSCSLVTLYLLVLTVRIVSYHCFHPMRSGTGPREFFQSDGHFHHLFYQHDNNGEEWLRVRVIRPSTSITPWELPPNSERFSAF